MITRASGYLTLRDDPVPPGTEALQADGYTVLAGVFGPEECQLLARDIERVFAEFPPDERRPKVAPTHWTPFRYEVLNRSGPAQAAIGHPRLLETIEPLLGEDCHVIANTAWWQPGGSNDHGGRFWHIDSGPTCPAIRACPGTTAFLTPSSRSPPTSSCGIARWRAAPPG